MNPDFPYPGRREPGTMPAVTHDVAMPLKVIDGRSYGNTAKHRASDWLGFLQTLAVGDSFVIPGPEYQTVAKYATQLGIDLVREHDVKTGSRVWIYGRPGQRNPVYLRADGKLYELNEVPVQP